LEREAKEAEEAREAREAKEAREAREAKESKEANGGSCETVHFPRFSAEIIVFQICGVWT
jgi:hypothetical protein